MDKVIHAIRVLSRAEAKHIIPMYAILDSRGMPTFPHLSKDDLEWKAKDEGARVQYWVSSAEARNSLRGVK